MSQAFTFHSPSTLSATRSSPVEPVDGLEAPPPAPPAPSAAPGPPRRPAIRRSSSAVTPHVRHSLDRLLDVPEGGDERNPHVPSPPPRRPSRGRHDEYPPPAGEGVGGRGVPARDAQQRYSVASDPLGHQPVLPEEGRQPVALLAEGGGAGPRVGVVGPGRRGRRRDEVRGGPPGGPASGGAPPPGPDPRPTKPLR